MARANYIHFKMVRTSSHGGSSKAATIDPIVERFREHRAINTPELSRALEGQHAIARIVSVHDGDTLTAVFDALGGFYKIHVRLDGIDAPEISSKTPANRHVAELARDRLVELIVDDPDRVAAFRAIDVKWPASSDALVKTGSNIDRLLDEDVYVVRIQCGHSEKYGRLLGRLSSAYSDAMSPSFGDVLVEERLALPYHGGHKMTDEDQMRALGRDVETGELIGGEDTVVVPSAASIGGFWRGGSNGYFTGWLPMGYLASRRAVAGRSSTDQ